MNLPPNPEAITDKIAEILKQAQQQCLCWDTPIVHPDGAVIQGLGSIINVPSVPLIETFPDSFYEQLEANESIAKIPESSLTVPVICLIGMLAISKIGNIGR